MILSAACLAALAALLPRPGLGQAAEPVSFTFRTIDNDAGVRVVLEFSRKPKYEVRGDGRRVYVTLREEETRPPFRKRDFEGPILERVRYSERSRASEIVFHTGPEFGTFSTFEMGEPFRLVIDLRRRPAPSAATRVEASGAAPAPGTAAPQAAIAGGGRAPSPATGAPARPAQEGAPAAPPAAALPGTGTWPPGEGPLPRGPDWRHAAFTVVVDPGHGGEEQGARGPSGLLEKDVTLDVARRIRSRLQGGTGTEVVLTRDDDRTVGLDERTAIANHARADLFVSIHANSSRRDGARGAETYFLSYQATDDEARAIAALENNALRLDDGVQGQSGLEMVLWDMAQSAHLKASSDLAERIQEHLNEALGVRNRGIKQAPFRVLMGATMPAVLVEIAFISSPDEERRLRDPGFKEEIARAIADSILRFRESLPR
jgi:N-acetylmuramoyl-L-alanine amidase